jgi:hypothetical protein
LQLLLHLADVGLPLVEFADVGVPADSSVAVVRSGVCCCYDQLRCAVVAADVGHTTGSTELQTDICEHCLSPIVEQVSFVSLLLTVSAVQSVLAAAWS